MKIKIIGHKYLIEPVIGLEFKWKSTGLIYKITDINQSNMIIVKDPTSTDIDRYINFSNMVTWDRECKNNKITVIN